MDFYNIKEREAGTGKKPLLEVYPDFKVVRSKDLMIRGKSFYAIWDEEKGLWSTDEYDVQRLVDAEIQDYKVTTQGLYEIYRKFLGSFGSNSWLQFRNYVGHLSDSSTQLDEHLTFANTDVRKEDYVSRRLPYALQSGSTSAWDELVGTLYDPSERDKLEWAIGSIVSGDSRHIQKFLVLYGAAGTGKSTVLNIIQNLFEGYYATFEAKALTGANNAFSTEAFKSNPLVAIQHDGDLSRIEDNTKLNSIISHEDMTVNEKYKPSYMTKINAFLFMGTNKPVKITDAKSGIIRRLIDVRPSGRLVGPRKYQALMSQVQFELGAIAYLCLERYREMGKDYYSGYRPLEMMLQTDVFFNFVEANYDIFKEQDGVTLNQAYELYKQYCDESMVEFKTPRYKFREELKNYFKHFEERAIINDLRVRSWYSGFDRDKFKVQTKTEVEHMLPLVLDEVESIFDKEFGAQPAQYANVHETPTRKWADVDTSLSELDPTQLHYVKLPVNHIVIDFDLKDADGQKSAALNLEAASKWPSTYAEYSKGGGGIHLHYIYEGDATQLSRVFDDGIEIKVFVGDASLRRKLTRCNNVPIAGLEGGLPLKEKRMIKADTIKSEKGLREMVERNLRKEIHAGTKPSIDFIHKILEDAYMTGMRYDLTDMRNKILAFAANSSNQALYCIKLVQGMRFHSDIEEPAVMDQPKDERWVIFDIECFKNLFVVCWKYHGDSNVVRMINPSPQAIEELMTLKLIGFNNRRYDNHMLYAAYLGYDNMALYKLSQKIIHGVPNALFGEAYNISYADIYDFSSKKQGLKKFQIELDLNHKELGLDWDEPVPDEMVDLVVEYCANDVDTTDEVLVDRMQDFVARQILADLSGLPVNSTTQQHTSKIVFNGNSKPQEEFVYTDLSEMFPGYRYDNGVSTYRGKGAPEDYEPEEVGEGGYVYAEPGMYSDVALLDVTSMHPTSIEQLDLFGSYTKNFSALKQARIAIKRKDFESAKKMLDGKLAKYLADESQAEALSYALKIVINIVYGLTSARFDNSFRDARNIDNIVAKRGALFMIDLKHFVQNQGFQVVHIKTDSIKIPGATKELIDMVMEFGLGYGYEFEHEATYEKFCLVNDAVYVAKKAAGRTPAEWVAVGAQFQNPYVFKKLFSKKPILFKDKCVTKEVKNASIFIDFDTEDTAMALAIGKRFVGRAGSFCPIKPGKGGGTLVRVVDDKAHAVTGTKGYEWLEAEVVKELGKEADIDVSYFNRQVDEAIDAINKFGDFEQFAD